MYKSIKLLEYFEENRKKVSYIPKLINQFKQGQISIEIFRLKLSKFLSKFSKRNIPIKIINDRYPQIFINCHIKNFKFLVDGIYISTSILRDFPTGEITAAILHELYHFIKTQKDPKLIRRFYLSRSIGYVYSMFLTTATIILKFLKSEKHKNYKYTKYLSYLGLILTIASILGLITTSYYYYKVGNEEILADSYATKFGYGKELIEFLNHYKEIENMYGHWSLPKLAEDLASSIRFFMRLLKLHPSDKKRTCEVLKQIIDKYDPKIKFDIDLFNWAKNEIHNYCSKSEISKVEIEKTKRLALYSLSKIKGK